MEDSLDQEDRGTCIREGVVPWPEKVLGNSGLTDCWLLSPACLMLPLVEPQFKLSQGGAATTNPSAGTRGNRTLAPLSSAAEIAVCCRECRLLQRTMTCHWLPPTAGRNSMESHLPSYKPLGLHLDYRRQNIDYM